MFRGLESREGQCKQELQSLEKKKSVVHDVCNFVKRLGDGLVEYVSGQGKPLPIKAQYFQAALDHFANQKDFLRFQFERMHEAEEAEKDSSKRFNEPSGVQPLSFAEEARVSHNVLHDVHESKSLYHTFLVSTIGGAGDDTTGREGGMSFGFLVCEVCAACCVCVWALWVCVSLSWCEYKRGRDYC